MISAVEEKGGMLNPRCKEDDRSIQGNAKRKREKLDCLAFLSLLHFELRIPRVIR